MKEIKAIIQPFKLSNVIEALKQIGARQAENPSIAHQSHQTDCERESLLGAPRIHGEMAKLGFDISESTVRILPSRIEGNPFAL